MTPSAALLWALAAQTGRDGFVASAEVTDAALASACAAGERLACPEARGSAPTCSPGSPVGCVLRAWQLADAPLTADTTRELRVSLLTACDAGEPRGCTELGLTYTTGLGTWQSEVQAKALFARACDAGEPEACRRLGERGDLGAEQRAIAAGHAGALADRAERTDDDALRAEACAAGAPAACSALERWARACELGATDDCVTDLLHRASNDGLTPHVVATALDPWCARGSERACREAAFLRTGSPIVPVDGGTYPVELEVDRWIYDLRDPLRTCQLEALHRDPEALGWLDVAFRIGETGRLSGVWIPDPFDAGLGACAEQVFLGATFRAPDLAPLRDGRAPRPATMTVTRRLPLFLSTTAKARSDADGPTVGLDLRRLAEQLTARGTALDACIVRHDDPRYITTAAFDATVKRDGRIVKRLWTSADVEPEARACLDAVLDPPLPKAPKVPLSASVDLTFLQPGPEPEALAPRVPFPPATSRTTLRTLVLVVGTSRVEGKDAAFATSTQDAIRAVHDELAVFVRDRSLGGLELAQELRTWEGPLRVGTVRQREEDIVFDPEAEPDEDADPDRDPETTFQLEAFELPDELVASIEAGRWDSVFLWVPVADPAGAQHGATWADETLRGATFSALALPADGDGLTLAAPLHELWHQLDARARRTLSTELPDAHEPPSTLAGRTTSPRTWAGSTTASAWYEERLSSFVHPELWVDLGRASDEDRSEPGDLALGAEILRDGGARRGEVLVDGRRSFGTFASGSTLERDRPSDDAGWWGVGFPSALPVGRVVARLATSAEAPPTVRRVAVEGRDGNTWETLVEVDVTGATVDVAVPPAAWDGVRVRVLAREGALEPTCTEIEVYPPAPGG